MKATTYNKCSSGTGVARRHGCAHLPKRRPAQADTNANPSDEGPRLTITVVDAQFNDITDEVHPGAVHRLDVPYVLLIDADGETAVALSSLLMPEARLIHAGSCAEARRLLETQLFSLVIVDPGLPDGDASRIVSAICNTPLLVYSAREPARLDQLTYLPKPWTTPRQLWSTISTMLGIGSGLTAGD